MNIRLVEYADRGRWDSFVHLHPQASPYHLFGWAEAVEKVYGFPKKCMIAERDNKVVGILPMNMLRIPFARSTLVSLPYCDVGSVLTENQTVAKKMIEYAIDVAEKQNATSIDLRGELTSEYMVGCDYPIEKIDNKVRMLLALPNSSDDLWRGFKSKLRSQVKKAEKNGLTFALENQKVDDFYTVFSRNMRDLGSPVHSKKWIEKIVEELGEFAKIGLVFQEDKVIGAGIILKAGNNISIPWASTLRTHNKLSPNMLLYWGILRYAADNGCSLFDFGRSTPGEGTYRFKAQWGAKPEALVWNKIFLCGNVPKKQSSPSKIREIVEKIWQGLPLPVANFVGPKFRKYISL